MADSDDGYQLVVSFPDQSPSFGHGLEAGKLWEQMRAGHVAEIEATTHLENREVIRRIADHLGWSTEVLPQLDGWDFTTLVKTRSPRGRPNPHGLALVS